jgi:hypothetical protein
VGPAEAWELEAAKPFGERRRRGIFVVEHAAQNELRGSGIFYLVRFKTMPHLIRCSGERVISRSCF